MIKLSPKPAVPATLLSAQVTNAKARIATKIASGETVTSQDFPPFWRKDDVRLTLWKHQQKKCCYCERPRDSKREPDIEHFRPKTEIAGEGKPGYWWLAYEWDNLFFSCKKCNQTKLTQFPLREGPRVRNPNTNLSTESPVLPHPEHENPEELIGFRWEFMPAEIAVPIGKDNEGRGSRTIKILGLDTIDLAEERGRLLLSLRAKAAMMHHALIADKSGLMRRTAQEINRETKSDNRFASLRREFFRAAGLGEYIASS
jgi:uncharacterized protein (TIGR02646 family)